MKKIVLSLIILAIFIPTIVIPVNSTGDLVVKSSIEAFSNVEMLRYTVTVSDTYRIVVYQSSDMPSAIQSENIFLAYNIS